MTAQEHEQLREFWRVLVQAEIRKLRRRGEKVCRELLEYAGIGKQ
jgi:hypothetical protein